jgi:hypothetical protein
MTQLSSNHTVRRGRVFPEKQLSTDEKARIKAEDAVFYKRCREVFSKSRSKHPGKKCIIMRINETGTCGRI